MADTPSIVYHFEPLSNKNEIRVLHLFPGDHGEVLSGDIQHVQLGQIPYESLSYKWGGQADGLHNFHLQDGRRLPITKALHGALADVRRASPQSQARLIWADSICINQADLQERSQQVALMGTIYRMATRVITYIGPEGDESLSGIQLAISLRDHVMWSRSPLREAELVDAGLPLLSDPKWLALRKLLLRPWVRAANNHDNVILPPFSLRNRIRFADFCCVCM